MDKVLRIRRFQVRPEEVLIIANGVKKESMPLSREIEDYLDEHQIRHSTIMTMSTSDDISIPYSTDFVISLGGDGTVLYVARKVHELGLPILPVNLGTFGYITEVGKNESSWPCKRQASSYSEKEGIAIIDLAPCQACANK